MEILNYNSQLKTLAISLVLFLIGETSLAQMPQYQYSYPPSKDYSLVSFSPPCISQSLYSYANFPSMPDGYIKNIYVKIGRDCTTNIATNGTCKIDGFSAAIGYTTKSTFKINTDSFITGLTTIYGPDSFIIPCIQKMGDWIKIPVRKNSFYYKQEGAKFVVEFRRRGKMGEGNFISFAQSISTLGESKTLLTHQDNPYGFTESSNVDLGIDLVSAGVDDVGSHLASLGLFPNPATEGRFTISMETKQAVRQLSISIRNAIGQTLYTTSYQNPGTRFFKEFDQSKLPSGVYFLELNVDGEKIVRQLVLQ